ncbi:hypothetical protein V8G54_006237, partial [Vigna mungo]
TIKNLKAIFHRDKRTLDNNLSHTKIDSSLSSQHPFFHCHGETPSSSSIHLSFSPPTSSTPEKQRRTHSLPNLYRTSIAFPIIITSTHLHTQNIKRHNSNTEPLLPFTNQNSFTNTTQFNILFHYTL